MTHVEESPELTTAGKLAQKIAEYRKAIAAFVVPVLGAVGIALTDGTISLPEWLVIAAVALGSPLAVGAVANRARLG